MQVLTQLEAEVLMVLPKFGDPESSWRQMKGHTGTVTNEFGVMDDQGAAIRGLLVAFEVYRPPRIAIDRFTFTLRRFEGGQLLRVYQQEINPRPGLRPKDHAFSHEHVGAARHTATSDWSTLSFPEAVARFCRQINLTLTEPLPDLDAFALR